MQHTVRKAQAGQVDPRQLANVAYGAARCGRSGMLRMLVAALARAAERRLSDLNPQAVANTAWAFATLNYRDEKLFAALAIAAARFVRYAVHYSSVACVGAILMEHEQRALLEGLEVVMSDFDAEMEFGTVATYAIAAERA